MNRHAWLEVRRQIRESGSAGLVALLLVVIATILAGGLWTIRGWIDAQLLPAERAATVVAVTRSVAAGPRIWADLHERFPSVTGGPVAPEGVRTMLGRWFPEYASLFAGLDPGSFPSLLDLGVPPAVETAVMTWLGENSDVIVAESSRTWQERLERGVQRLILAGFLVSATLLLACSVLVLLVVRLLVLDHTDEIAIMRLIGAREREVRLPYLASGLIIGLAGGALGGATLAACAVWARTVLPGLTVAPGLLAALPFVGAAAAAVGAAMGLAALPQEP